MPLMAARECMIHDASSSSSTCLSCTQQTSVGGAWPSPFSPSRTLSQHIFNPFPLLLPLPLPPFYGQAEPQSPLPSSHLGGQVALTQEGGEARAGTATPQARARAHVAPAYVLHGPPPTSKNCSHRLPLCLNAQQNAWRLGVEEVQPLSHGQIIQT